MNKTKIKNFALSFILLLFIVSLALSVVTLFKANAEETVGDVDFNFVEYGDLTKETDSVYGTSMESYGNTVNGWGGWLKVCKINNENGVDASGIAATGKGALSFWLYIADEGTRDAYMSAQFTGWNIDVCSAESYNDTNKYSFNVARNKCEGFQNVRLGWQRVVLPFSAADEKNQIDWATVRYFRFNQNVPGGKNNIKVGGFSFTTTNLTKYTITGDPVVTFGVGSVSAMVGNVASVTKLENAELGETLDGYGRPNEGGFVSLLNLDKAYGVTTASDSAFSVWVYFQKESDKTALNAYSIDVSSGESYSDSHKYCFNVKKLFGKCSVGWNQLIIPLDSADEKNGMDWNDVRNIRLNVDGGTACYVLTAKYEIIHSGVTEPTVVGYVAPEPVDPPVDNTETLTNEGGIVSVKTFGTGDVLATDSTNANIATLTELDNNTTAQYVCANTPNGNWGAWGGMVHLLVLDKPYNVSAISTNQKGAFTFWFYIANDATLSNLKNVSEFKLNLSKGENYSDEYKWHYNIVPLASDMMVGWNKIIIPFSSSMCMNGDKGPTADNTVGNIRLVFNSGYGGGTADFAFADFGFFLTDETEPCVINRKTQMTKPDDVTFTVANAAELTADNDLLAGKTAYSAIGKNWGAKTQLVTFDKAYDLSNHSVYGKSVLSLAIYFADEATLEAHRAIQSGYTVTLGSGDSFNAANAYQFDIAPQLADCSAGWNTIYLPVDTADSKGELDWASVKFLQIAWDKAFGEGECEVAFAGFALISTDETARSVENDSGVSLSVIQVEELAKVQLIRNKKNITSYSTIGKGWGRLSEKKFTLAKSYNASKFQNNGAFTFWFYIENENTLNAHKAVEGNWFVTLYSGAYQGANKLTFEIHSVFADCIVGWNKLVLPFAAATDGSFDFGAISSFSINQDKATAIEAPNQNQIALAEFAIVATELTQMTVAETVSSIEEGLNPIAEQVIIDCNVTNGLMFSGNKVDSQDCRYESGCVYTSGAGYQLSAQFEGGETDLRKNTIILAFWLWIEDPAYYYEEDGVTLKSSINGQIELASDRGWDTNEINWEIKQWGLDKMQKGWNWVVLKGADGNISGGDPNFDALVRFRLYVNGIQQSTMKIDRITIGSSESLLTAPDWEKEIFSKDPESGFKGANAYMPANDSYLEVDFDNGAKDFTTVVTEIVQETVIRTEEGCAGSVSVAPVAVVVLIGAIAICVLVVRRKKDGGK